MVSGDLKAVTNSGQGVRYRPVENGAITLISQARLCLSHDLGLNPLTKE